MLSINVLKGVKYVPETLVNKISSSNKHRLIDCRYIDVLYSPCWIFAFGAVIRFSQAKQKFVGYLGGVDELTLSPGTVTALPETEEIKVMEKNVLSDKITEARAEELAWEYSKRWVIRKNRILHKVPEKTQTHSYKVYKPLYLFEFYKKEEERTFYKIMDSLTGDLENIELV